MQVLFPLKYLKNRQTCLIGDVLDRVSRLKAFTDRYVAQCLYQVHWIYSPSQPLEVRRNPAAISWNGELTVPFRTQGRF